MWRSLVSCKKKNEESGSRRLRRIPNIIIAGACISFISLASSASYDDGLDVENLNAGRRRRRTRNILAGFNHFD